jgi:hypothetical protein
LRMARPACSGQAGLDHGIRVWLRHTTAGPQIGIQRLERRQWQTAGSQGSFICEPKLL